MIKFAIVIKLLVNGWQLYDNSDAPHSAGKRMTTMKAPVSHSKDPVLPKAPQALLRASERVRLLAEQTGTPFIVRQPAKTGNHK
ncbi:MAG TPA: hypothetical protein VIM35_02940 [Gallionella sp.]